MLTQDPRGTYFSILVTHLERDRIYQHALQNGILLGRVFENIAGLGRSDCPTANEIAKCVLNLPFLVHTEHRETVVETLLEVIKPQKSILRVFNWPFI